MDVIKSTNSKEDKNTSTPETYSTLQKIIQTTFFFTTKFNQFKELIKAIPAALSGVIFQSGNMHND